MEVYTSKTIWAAQIGLEGFFKKRYKAGWVGKEGGSGKSRGKEGKYDQNIVYEILEN